MSRIFFVFCLSHFSEFRFSSVQSFDQIPNRIGKSVQLTNQVHSTNQLIDQLISKMTNQVNVTDQLINRMNMIGQQTILASLVS